MIVRGDPTRLRQILLNLIGNAIKFTEQGEVVVTVGEQWRNNDEVGLHFTVRDTGIGIPQQQLDKVFEAFQQADTSTTRRYGGTGLGLTISAELVRLLKGRIWVQSKREKEARFISRCVCSWARPAVCPPRKCSRRFRNPLRRTSVQLQQSWVTTSTAASSGGR